MNERWILRRAKFQERIESTKMNRQMGKASGEIEFARPSCTGIRDLDGSSYLLRVTRWKCANRVVAVLWFVKVKAGLSTSASGTGKLYMK